MVTMPQSILSLRKADVQCPGCLAFALALATAHDEDWALIPTAKMRELRRHCDAEYARRTAEPKDPAFANGGCGCDPPLE